jgi:hypothetical protein
VRAAFFADADRLRLLAARVRAAFFAAADRLRFGLARRLVVRRRVVFLRRGALRFADFLLFVTFLRAMFFPLFVLRDLVDALRRVVLRCADFFRRFGGLTIITSDNGTP